MDHPDLSQESVIIEPHIEMPSILRAACDLFCINGYHGTSIRSIAERAQLSVPGVYHHYPSKQKILDELVTLAIDELLSSSRIADASSDGTAIGRLNAVIGVMIRFHILCRREAFVASTEMRSMEPDVLRKHIQKRDEQQLLITSIIIQGISERIFYCSHVKEVSRAIASLCVSISTWYRPSGHLTTRELVKRYLGIIHRVIDYRISAMNNQPDTKRRVHN